MPMNPAGPVDPHRDHRWDFSCCVWSPLRYGLHARRVAYATLYTEGFSSFVASAAASIATGWNEPVPVRVYLPLWTTTFSRRTRLANLGKRKPSAERSTLSTAHCQY